MPTTGNTEKKLINDNKGNYDFLQHSFPELYLIAREADEFYSIDHSCCLLKARLFAELWCHEVSELFSVVLEEKEDIVKKINEVRAIAKLPDYIYRALNELRLAGNKSVHVTRLLGAQWSGQVTLSKTRLRMLMKCMHDLAFFLAFKIENSEIDQGDFDTWVEPSRDFFAKDIASAMTGDANATFAIAKRSYEILNKIDSSCKSRVNWKIVQRDLEYWLERAFLLGHSSAWLMYARAYETKKLLIPDGMSVDIAFKNAIKEQDCSDALFMYGYYQLGQGNPKGIELINQSADMGYPQAIEHMQVLSYKNGVDFQKWVDIGIEHQVPSSFMLDLHLKIEAFERNIDDDLAKKRMITALVDSETRAPSDTKYLSLYCRAMGYRGIKPESLSKADRCDLINAFKKTPSFISLHKGLFLLLKDHPSEYHYAFMIAKPALDSLQDGVGKANFKFVIVTYILSALKYAAHNNLGKIPGAFNIRDLLLESINEGCEDAIKFSNTGEGKKLINNKLFRSVSSGHKVVDRKKASRAKKLAKKARRK